MKNFRILLTASTGFISRAIMWFTKSPYSHSAIAFELEGRQMVVGADANGFVMQSRERFLRHNRIVRTWQFFGALDRPATKQWLLDFLDEPYDYLGLFSGVLMMVKRRIFSRWGWASKKSPNPTHSQNALFCSEACVYLLRAACFPGASELDPDGTTPQDLDEWLSAVAGSVCIEPE